MRENTPIVIGICGGSGSGKTTLIKRLQDEIAHLNPALFTMDNYYRPMETQVRDENGIINFDLPTALDEQQLSQDLTQLYQGNSIEVKEYFFNTQPVKNVLLTIHPAKIILVEGLFLFHYPEVFKLIDWSVYVDVDPKIQLDRRVYRDQSTRGYRHQEIIYQWENHVLPCYKSYIEPYRKKANFVFNNDERAEADFVKLMEQIQHLLTQRGVLA
ncbi:MAG: uridine kinase [Flavobacteriia bacterium]|nr:uridine kinase [Flavobacteriia bacterium]